MGKRGIITIEGRTVVVPDTEIWMTAGEIASLFYVRGVSVEAAIRKLLKGCIVYYIQFFTLYRAAVDVILRLLFFVCQGT